MFKILKSIVLSKSFSFDLFKSESGGWKYENVRIPFIWFKVKKITKKEYFGNQKALFIGDYMFILTKIKRNRGTK